MAIGLCVENQVALTTRAGDFAVVTCVAITTWIPVVMSMAVLYNHKHASCTQTSANVTSAYKCFSISIQS